jgi:hypothetical protein
LILAKEVLRSLKLDFDPFEKYGGVGAEDLTTKMAIWLLCSTQLLLNTTKSREQMNQPFKCCSQT